MEILFICQVVTTPGILNISLPTNDLTIGWQKLNPPSHPNAILAPKARQARASGEILTTC